MATSFEIEIIIPEVETGTKLSENDLFELRNYLNENLQGEGLNFQVKEAPMREGQMGELAELVLSGMLHASMAVPIELFFAKVLAPKIEHWAKERSKSNNLPNIEVRSSIKGKGFQSAYLSGSSGKIQELGHATYLIEDEYTHAILIGCSDYHGNFPAIPPVKANIEEMYKILSDKNFLGLPEKNIVTCYNQTSVEIQLALSNISHEPNIKTLIIYYAGHGHYTDTNQLYLTATNTQKSHGNIIGGIDFNFIRKDILMRSPARQKILFIDACHSGIAVHPAHNPLYEIEGKGKHANPESSENEGPIGFYTMTSSASDKLSYFNNENDDDPTYFTASIAQALKNGVDNDNEYLSLDDVFEYSQKTLTLDYKLPSPHNKNVLVDYKTGMYFSPSNFFIAKNAAFSSEKLKTAVEQNIKDLVLFEARLKIEKLRKQFRYDAAILIWADNRERFLNFLQFKENGDAEFGIGKYSDAEKEYVMSLQTLIDEEDDPKSNLRNEVKSKLNKCRKEILAGGSMGGGSKGFGDPPQQLNNNKFHKIKNMFMSNWKKIAVIAVPVLLLGFFALNGMIPWKHSSEDVKNTAGNDTANYFLGSFVAPPVDIIDTNNSKLKAIVEMGATGFDYSIIRINEKKQWELFKYKPGWSRAYEGDANYDSILKKINKYIAEIRKFGVSSSDIHFVISSGANQQKNVQTMTSALVTLGYVVNTVTPQEEATYALNCALPNMYDGKGFVVDVGSSNTKIAWTDNGKVVTQIANGSKYRIRKIDDNEVYNSIKNSLKDMPEECKKCCFIIGGVPYQLANIARVDNERYTQLKSPNHYSPASFKLKPDDLEKLKGGLNIYKAISDGAGCKSFVFDWGSHFGIGLLLKLPY